MKEIDCIYFKCGECVNAEVVRSSVKKVGEPTMCFLKDKVEKEGVITVCKAQSQIRLMDGFWRVC